jgi:hypothetical protein
MNTILDYFLNIWYVWLPWILGFIFLKLWRMYIEENTLQKKVRNKYKLLEIYLPKEVHKSPEAMEIIINILWYTGGGAADWKQRLLLGAVLIPSSLEVISVEGSIYFFIRTYAKIADLVKNAIYSQYPDAEVNEVDDYTKYVADYNIHHDTWSLFGSEYGLAKDVFIPIKTYIDYGLDKAVGSLEENEKIDPISPMLEYLGSLKKGEQIWIQYIVQADIFTNWKDAAKEKIKEIMGRGQEIADDEPYQTVKLTHGEQEMVKGIERTLHKHTFEVVTRALYLAPNNHFVKNNRNILKNGVFKPFASKYFNEIKKTVDSGLVDWKYENITGKRTHALNKRFFNDYIKREAFHEPVWKYLNFLWYKRRPTTILSSEELATLFHIPGRASTTPTLERIEAVKSDAPQNLPI